MTQSRRELRQQRQSSQTPPDDIRLDPEVLRAVAKKMRERNSEPNVNMPSKVYILKTVLFEFIKSLEEVADESEPAVRFLQQKDTDGQEGSNGLH